MRFDQRFPVILGRFFKGLRASDKVLGAKPDVANFVVKDALEDTCAVFVTELRNSVAGGWRDVEPAGFKHHRYDC